MTIKVFISHAADDEQLAKALVDFLFSCMYLDDEEVRCTSVPGHKLPIGSDVAKTLRDDLGESSVVIGLLTPRSLHSSWVLFELGAAWGSHKKIKPLLSDAIDFSDLPGPLTGLHAVRLSDENGLIQLIDEVHQIVGARKHGAPKVHAAAQKLTEVHSQIQEAVQKATSPKPVTTRVKEPTISGMPFSEMVRVLQAEKVTVPAHLTGTGKEQTISLLGALVNNCDLLASGVYSTWDPNEPGGFLYHFVAVKLLPFQLVKYEKLPASRRYQRILLSANGQKFISHFKRLASLPNTDDRNKRMADLDGVAIEILKKIAEENKGTVESLSSIFNMPEQEIRYYLDTLRARDFLGRPFISLTQPAKYSITRKGREYLVKKGLIPKK